MVDRASLLLVSQACSCKNNACSWLRTFPIARARVGPSVLVLGGSPTVSAGPTGEVLTLRFRRTKPPAASRADSEVAPRAVDPVTAVRAAGPPRHWPRRRPPPVRHPTAGFLRAHTRTTGLPPGRRWCGHRPAPAGSGRSQSRNGSHPANGRKLLHGRVEGLFGQVGRDLTHPVREALQVDRARVLGERRDRLEHLVAPCEQRALSCAPPARRHPTRGRHSSCRDW